MIVSLLRKFLLIGAMLLVASCGSGGGGDNVASGGIGGTGISAGAITGFGSVFVNGVEFDSSGASITVNGVPASESELKVGMVVTVLGTINGNTGTAATVTAEDVVQGPVEQVVDANTLIVLGQTVTVDENTGLDNNVLPVAGDLVEIYGFVKDKGLIAGTLVETKAALAEFGVTGFVENTNATTFTIGALTINYSAADTSGLPGGAPSDGLMVEVKGSNLLGPVGELIAAKVELAGLGLANASEAEVEGFVTDDANAPGEFTLGNQLVQTTASTQFEGGTPGDIAVGVKLEVEGALVNGVLIAREVEFRDDIKLESDVASVGTAPDRLTLTGLTGITVTVDGLTDIEGNANRFADIAVGDHVRIRGRRTAGGVVLATRLEERSADTTLILQGPVDAVPAPADPNVSILGVTVDTTPIADDQFQGFDGAAVGRASFFDPVTGVAAGDLVKAQGRVDAIGTVSWEEIELED